MKITAGKSSMEIFPRFGGAVGQLFLEPPGGGEAVPVLYPDPPEELEENPWFRGRILFPFCDRIPGGRYSFGGRDYRLVANQEDGSAIHGLIHNRPGTLTAQSATGTSQSLTLGWELGEDSGYPFRLEFFVCYRISTSVDGGGRAELICHAHNLGEEAAPAGFGWHSYFRLPAVPAAEHKITIPSQTFVEVESDLMPTGRFPEVSKSSGGLYDFRTGKAPGADSYDIAFPASDASSRRATIAAGTRRISMAIEGAFSYFQLFTPPDGNSIALEPLTNVTDAFNRDDMGMRGLERGGRMSGKIVLSLQNDPALS